MLIETPALEGVAATAWLTVAARARALRGDARAAELASRLRLDVAQDEAFVKGVVLRANWFDRTVEAILADGPQGMVITLGAGFCTRRSRLLLLPRSTAWVNIDLPDVIALRERYLPSGETERNLAFSMLDPAWLDQVGLSRNRPVVVVMEGVCPYLPQRPLENLLHSLAARFADRGITGCLVLDFTHPALAQQPMQVGGVTLPLVSGFKDIDHLLALHASMRLIDMEHPYSGFSAGHRLFEEAFIAACGHPPYTMSCLALG